MTGELWVGSTHRARALTRFCTNRNFMTTSPLYDFDPSSRNPAANNTDRFTFDQIFVAGFMPSSKKKEGSDGNDGLFTESPSENENDDRRVAIPLPQTINNPSLVQIVGGHLDLDPVSDGQPDESVSHLAGNVRQDNVPVIKFHSEHGSSQNGLNLSFQFDMIFHPIDIRFRLGLFPPESGA